LFEDLPELYLPDFEPGRLALRVEDYKKPAAYLQTAVLPPQPL